MQNIINFFNTENYEYISNNFSIVFNHNNNEIHLYFEGFTKDDYFDLEPEKAPQEIVPETSKNSFNPDLAEKVEFPQMEKEPEAPFVPTIKLSGSDDTSASDPFFSA